MAPQASKKCDRLPPDHQQIGCCTRNSLNSEQASGSIFMPTLAGDKSLWRVRSARTRKTRNGKPNTPVEIGERKTVCRFCMPPVSS